MSDASKLAFLAKAREPFTPSPQKAVVVVEPQPSISDVEKQLLRLIIKFLESET